MKKLKYILYIIQWHIGHFKKEYVEMYPVCFNEWLNNEYEVKGN